MIKKSKMLRCVVLAFVVLTLGLASCSKEGDTIYQTPEEEQPNLSPLVTVVYDADALGDRMFNDLIYQGVEQAATEYGLRTLQLTPESREEGLAYLETLFQSLSAMQDTVRRLVIITTPAYDEFIRQNNRRLESNPYVDLLYLESRTPLEGKGSTLYVPYYGAMYHAAALAPHYTNEVLVVGANQANESVAEAIQGFRDGFATSFFPGADERVLDVEYLGTRVDEGFSIADTTAMKFLLDRKDKYTRPLLVPICGGSAMTFHRMSESHLPFMLMGVDVTINSDACPFSAVKYMDHAVRHCIGQWLSAEGLPKHQSLGLAEGYTGVTFNMMSALNSWAYQGEMTDEIIKATYEEAVRKEAEYEK